MQLQVKNALEATRVCKVIMIQSRGGDTRVAFRVSDLPRWYRYLSSYLAREDHEKWLSHMGEKYLLNNGKLAKVWLWMIDAPPGVTLSDAIDAACLCLTQVVSKSDNTNSELLAPGPVSIPGSWAIGPQTAKRVSVTGSDE
jgi:hypothetical protein